MRIFDCFMYFDEDLILDARLNILDKYVDFFIIVESKYNHKGEKRSLKLDLEKFKKFKNKIKYLVIEDLPNNLEVITGQDFGLTKEHKFINNAVKRENFQRNFIKKGLDEAQDEDFILISDLDEIPCLENLNLKSVKERIIVFKQLMTYYKFNLALPNFWWHGTKGCLKKNLKSPQWLRNIKPKKIGETKESNRRRLKQIQTMRRNLKVIKSQRQKKRKALEETRNLRRKSRNPKKSRNVKQLVKLLQRKPLQK